MGSPVPNAAHVDHLQSVWQELHPMIAHCVPVLLRTSIESRSIACHEYAMKALITAVPVNDSLLCNFGFSVSTGALCKYGLKLNSLLRSG